MHRKAMSKSKIRAIAVAIAALFLAACSGGEGVGHVSDVANEAAAHFIGMAQVGVNLGATANVYGIANTGTPVTDGGLDGGGYAYAAALLGTSVTWEGSTFTLGTAGSADAVSNKTIALPAGNYSSVILLATGVNGNQAKQTFVVKYTDGTSTSIVQSLSDWHTPQSYPGESTASTMAYRIGASGATQAGAFYLYAYSFAINSAKTVQSMTLPDNRDVVVLAVDLLPVASSPTMSPPPGTYSTAQTVTLSDTTPGAVIYYTTNGTAPTTGSAQYSLPLQVSATTSIEAMAAASGYIDSAITSATYIIGTAPVAVNLGAAANVYGIANTGTAAADGGLDDDGNAYAAALLGTSVAWEGSTFTLGAAGSADAASNKTIALPAGIYSSVVLLATGVNGNQAKQTFVVKYADGTSTSFVQSLSDWHTPQSYPGESTASTMAYRIGASGAAQAGAFYLYAYSFAINGAKTVQSIALPDNRDVVVLAVDLLPVASPVPSSPTLSPPPGSYSTAQTVTLSDTPGAVIYYTTNGTAPTTGSAQYSLPLRVSATTTIEALAAANG
jgi:hypothetical protein